jgi:formylglycine-generating enzyme required for sulfatase activity
MHILKSIFSSKILIYNSFILQLFFLLSCSDDPFISENGSPSIISIVNKNTFVNDTITIYGENLGDPGLNSYVVFTGSNKDTIIHSSKCLQWTVSKVKLIVPNTNSTRINLVCNSINTDFLEIIINKLPDLATVEIAPGKFLMGSIFGLKDELPVHEIEISSTLIVSKYEINQFYYMQVMGTNHSIIKDNRLPVDSISWIDAIIFCNKLSEISNLQPAYTFFGENVKWDTIANGWRLPTEAEWEYLCRAGDTSDYSGSDDLSKIGWYNMNSGLKSHPSGLKQANKFGLFDMQGNLWEWCWDYYSSEYYSKSDYKNPKGPDTGVRHIARGGSYGDGNSLCRSSNRFFPINAIERTGIRIVRTK